MPLIKLAHAYWKEESIKTRIETSSWWLISRSFSIEKKNPLKQGLKLKHSHFYRQSISNWKEESIKTRIETSMRAFLSCCYWYWKEESIKTRIETLSHQLVHCLASYWKEESIKTRIETSDLAMSDIFIGIEKKNPLKQGLKLFLLDFM